MNLRRRGSQPVCMMLAVCAGGFAITLAAVAEMPEGSGLAAQYPGDAGIGADPAVVFVENFAEGALEDVRDRWGYARNLEGMAFSDDTPPGAAGTRALRMTGRRGEDQGGELYKTFGGGGWDRVFLRFYTRFAADHGAHHHFVALRGFPDPDPWPAGGAGQRPERHFSVTIEPSMASRNEFPPTRRFAPPGVWQFYAYWPEMQSWQSASGEPDGRPNPYYGNVFMPPDPGHSVRRGEWTCVEVMLKLNSHPDAKDGELALWLDGELAVHFAPGQPVGVMVGDHFRNHPEHSGAAPFEGFRWRRDMDTGVNVLRLQHYVSDRAWERTLAYAEANPEFEVNTDEATVYFANIVLATEYIGPITPAEE